jgi:mevalonate kinase
MTTSSERPDTAPGQRPTVATACGKVILLGEHSVVYGEPALAVPLTGLRLSVVLASAGPTWIPAGASDSGSIRSPIPSAEAIQDGVETLAMPAVGSPDFEAMGAEDEAARTLEQAELAPLTIDVDAAAPQGTHAAISRALGTAARALGLAVPLPLRVAVRSGGLRSGMGTSAALGTAMGRALLSWYGEEPDPARVLVAAAATERLFHDDPSGVDHTVSVSEAPVWFCKGKEPLLLSSLPSLELVLLPRQSSRSTSSLVEGVRQRLVADPSLVRVVAEMGRWSRAGRSAWDAGDLDGLARAMNDQQGSLEKLGVVHDDDRRGIAMALEAGALAAKVTGAGWGGTLLALAEEETADAVTRAWGAGALRFRVG